LQDREPSEECFQETILAWDSADTVIRSPYGEFADFKIAAKDVSEGTFPKASQWRMNPIPACNCDKGYNCTTDGDPVYAPYSDGTTGGHPCETVRDVVV